MQQIERHGGHCVRKAFKTFKPEEFSAYRRSAATESSETLQLPMSSNVVVTASPELGYTRTNDDILDILDPEIRRVDGSIQHAV